MKSAAIAALAATLEDGTEPASTPPSIAREPGYFPGPWSFDGAADPLAEEFCCEEIGVSMTSIAVPRGVLMPFPGHRWINRICTNCGRTIGGSGGGDQERGLCGPCGGENWAKGRKRRQEALRSPPGAFPSDTDYSGR